MFCSVPLNLTFNKGDLWFVFSSSIGCWPTSQPQVTGGSGWIQFVPQIPDRGPESLQVKPRGSGWSPACQACWLFSLLNSIGDNCTNIVGRVCTSLCAGRMKCEPSRDEACRECWMEAKHSRGFWAERLLSCEPWFQGGQCRSSLLGPIPRDKFTTFGLFPLHLTHYFKTK